MFKNLFRAILGFFGVIKKPLKYKKTEYADFVRGLPPATIILMCDRTPSIVGNMITSISDSPMSHVGMYVGESYGNYIRSKYPHLMKKRILYIHGNKLELKPLTEKAVKHEIIEALLTVSTTPLDKDYKHSDSQMEAWSRPLTQQETEQIVLRAYEMVGMPYDILEIGSHIFPFIPNSTKVKVCSSLHVHSYEPVERIVFKKVDEEKASPGDLRKYFMQTDHWSRRKYNH